MKRLEQTLFHEASCRAGLDQLRLLLASNAGLSEREHIQPLFRQHPQLAAFIGTTIPNIGPANRLAFEFPIAGDFRADITVGNYDRSTFCAIELEDALPNSVFTAGQGRATTAWGSRLERGFSQLVDWFCAFDDQKNTRAFMKHFGASHVSFFGMLVIGRSSHITPDDRARLQWRSDRVSINAHRVLCMTYDDLLNALESQWALMGMMRTKPVNPPVI